MKMTIEVPTRYHSDYTEDTATFKGGDDYIVIKYRGLEFEIQKEEFAKIADVLCD
ncbi:hypothetical protein P4284_22990 [Bacillus swezeyi]|uniref:hypothetical protein n=1 Tax=Bacillus swezeyi TaxID=1925020 RepID=UPI002E1C392F|nr:hypothetical protein [Bacillus swezeyi]